MSRIQTDPLPNTILMLAQVFESLKIPCMSDSKDADKSKKEKVTTFLLRLLLQAMPHLCYQNASKKYFIFTLTQLTYRYIVRP